MPERNLGIDKNKVSASTRRNLAILNPIDLPGGDRIYPESFQKGLYPHWGILKREKTGETFLLTERRFDSIDRFFGGLPSRLIRFYLSQAQNDQVTVLDLGGGRGALAARQIALRYPGVRVLNIDCVAIDETQGNFTSKPGDICNLELPDGSIHFAYSHQVLPYMRDQDSFSRHIRGIEEIVRVLRVGGSGVIDYTDAESVSDDILRRIGQKFGGLMLPKSKSYGGAFLLIAIDPVDPAILRMSSEVPNFVMN